MPFKVLILKLYTLEICLTRTDDPSGSVRTLDFFYLDSSLLLFSKEMYLIFEDFQFFQLSVWLFFDFSRSENFSGRNHVLGGYSTLLIWFAERPADQDLHSLSLGTWLHYLCLMERDPPVFLNCSPIWWRYK